jgi:prepilin-type processing-associated H-X9-DG protein
MNHEFAGASPPTLDYASPRTKTPRRVPWMMILVALFAIVGVGAALLPPLGKCGCVSTRVQCGTNEHQILTAIFEYAQKHNGAAPPSSWVHIAIGTLLLLLLLLGGLVFLSSMGRAKPIAQRAQCGTNEHQLVTAIFDYAQKNGGNLPASLQVLRGPVSSTSNSAAKIFHCPTGPGDYIYVGAGMNLSTAAKGTILLYEPPTNHKDSKTGKPAMNVGYADGSVRTIVQPQADKIIAELKAGHNPPRAEMIK